MTQPVATTATGFQMTFLYVIKVEIHDPSRFSLICRNMPSIEDINIFQALCAAAQPLAMACCSCFSLASRAIRTARAASVPEIWQKVMHTAICVPATA